jgi:hypothetical protein
VYARLFAVDGVFLHGKFDISTPAGWLTSLLRKTGGLRDVASFDDFAQENVPISP